MAPVPEQATEPLLAPSNGRIAEEDGETDMGKPQKGVWAAEFRHILVLSAPAIVQLCTQQALVITNQVRCLPCREVATMHVAGLPLTQLSCGPVFASCRSSEAGGSSLVPTISICNLICSRKQRYMDISGFASRVHQS